MSENVIYKIGITHGDINGISYEVIIKALADNRIIDLCTPIIYGNSKIVQFYKRIVEIPEFSFQIINNVDTPSLKKVNLLNISEKDILVEPGKTTYDAGHLAELSLNYACRDLKNDKIHAIVTAPINKSNMPRESFKFPGHTEFFSAQFNASNSMMLMITDTLKVGFVTQHLPLSAVANQISCDVILKKLKILHTSLLKDFLIVNPKIAVLSLNPHAGDEGIIGFEEGNTIIPAIQKAWNESVNAFGPFAADGFFGSGEYRKYDAVLAMYHDQGMIPFKLLSQNEGVNFTAGLPIVRTSPAHGTAYDIAGKNKADERSFRNAIYWAIDIVKNRNS
jgi:4-hydroxythreonine-4-phosphate dehydrogenase